MAKYHLNSTTHHTHHNPPQPTTKMQESEIFYTGRKKEDEMKGRGYFILDEFYSCKSALLERIRGIRDKYKDDERLRPYDFEFMCEVLKGHPDYALKAGVGIEAITVRIDPIWGNSRCFIIIRTDGSQTDFSFRECLTATTHNQKFNNALRTAIESDILAFKQEFFDNSIGTVYCPYTHEVLHFVGAHVDHKAPFTFKNLVSIFVNKFGIDIDKVVINEASADNTYQDTLADKELEARWIEFHRQHARLQVVSKTANLSILRH